MASFEPPPAWARVVSMVLGFCTIVVACVTVMVQWAFLGMLSLHVWSPWGLGVAIVVMATQTLLLMETSARKAASCEIPRD